MYKGDPLVHCYLHGELNSEEEFRQLDRIVETWRERLADISWFMRCLNEYIARRANEEDDCTGRFWEGRFKSQALLDEAALLSRMAYVDLNPVRTGICETLQESEFTSIQARIRQLSEEEHDPTRRPSPKLMPFHTEVEHEQESALLSFELRDYIQLVDWTGQIVRSDKQGFISREASSALSDLNLNAAQWRTLALEIQKESIIMFHGLDKLAALERKQTNQAA